MGDKNNAANKYNAKANSFDGKAGLIRSALGLAVGVGGMIIAKSTGQSPIPYVIIGAVLTFPKKQTSP